MSDAPEPITSLFGSQPGPIRDRLLGCWIPAKYRIQEVLHRLGLRGFEPRLMFVRAPRAIGTTEGTVVESFDSTDPDLSKDHLDQLSAAAEMWRRAPSAERSRLLGEFSRLALRLFDSLGNDVACWGGLPCLVDEHVVVPVLVYKGSGLARVLGALENPGASLATSRTAGPALNLILLVIQGAINEVSRALRDHEWGSMDLTLRDPVEVLRHAGRELLSFAVQGLPSASGLYETCCSISAMPYEQRVSTGAVLLARPDDSRLQDVLLLQQPIPLSHDHARSVRKLLEATSPDSSLLSDAQTVFGLGRANDGEKRPAMRRIVFEGRGVWSLHVGYRRAMIVRDGVPGLPWTRVDEGRFRRGIRALDATVGDDTVRQLLDLVQAAANGAHGAVFVFCRDPARAVAELGPQCMACEPFTLTAARASELSNVDGAVLLGLDARCHAFGAILDGRATEAEDRSRGARYNSAVRYTALNAGSVLAVVVSSDGMVDVLGPGETEEASTA